jgi:hypothetical protein
VLIVSTDYEMFVLCTFLLVKVASHLQLGQFLGTRDTTSGSKVKDAIELSCNVIKGGTQCHHTGLGTDARFQLSVDLVLRMRQTPIQRCPPLLEQPAIV